MGEYSPTGKIPIEFDFRQYDPPQRDESKHLRKATMKYFLKNSGDYFSIDLKFGIEVKPVTLGSKDYFHLSYGI